MMQALIVNANQYKYTDDAENIRQGLNITYMQPINDDESFVDSENWKNGYNIITVSAPETMKGHFVNKSHFPLLCELEIGIKTFGRKNSPFLYGLTVVKEKATFSDLHVNKKG